MLWRLRAIAVLTTCPVLGLAHQAFKQAQEGSGFAASLPPRSSTCDAPFKPVFSLMGPDAVRCAECLTSPETKSTLDCYVACAELPEGQEFFHIGDGYGPISKSCLPGPVCAVNSSQSTEACRCCGTDLGFGYCMPPADDDDPLYETFGELSNFKHDCTSAVMGANCATCILWRKLRGGYVDGPQISLPCTPADQCYQTVDGKHTFMATFPDTDPARFLLLPGSKQADWPVVGIEDPQVLGDGLKGEWSLAWQSAFRPYEVIDPSIARMSVPNLPPSNYSCRIGLAINPASSRSQQQMHIHIARIPLPLRQLFVGREVNFGSWTKVVIPLTVEVDRPVAYAKYFRLDGSVKGPGDFDIFGLAYAFAGFDLLRLQAWGVVLLPDEEAIAVDSPNGPMPRGFYLVLAPNNRWGTWNPYRSVGVNANFIPEHLLCTSSSLEDVGGFWARRDCPATMPGPHYTQMLADYEAKLRWIATHPPEPDTSPSPSPR